MGYLTEGGNLPASRVLAITNTSGDPLKFSWTRSDEVELVSDLRFHLGLTAAARGGGTWSLRQRRGAGVGAGESGPSFTAYPKRTPSS